MKVLSGELAIELDGVMQILTVGQSVMVEPGVGHILKSNLSSPVRLFCTNFPAFDGTDNYLV
ncbi:MAG: cupin domain-containing protein [Gammaproteobacteria bacterium]|nr:cupin domain-containing protein [Gammaproteobacteria bacterium]